MSKILNCLEIKDGVKTGKSFLVNENNFSLDLKKCAKIYTKNGVNVFLDSKTFTLLKKEI